MGDMGDVPNILKKLDRLNKRVIIISNDTKLSETKPNDYRLLDFTDSLKYIKKINGFRI